ncbi:Uncharacterised protein [Vibrio cholerae]|nr:Uncharacterised protein [Vibrio cholerae]CSD13853.1 Uncharacterised protein [Vibrio cholerae]CSD28685.1 Uncharacterised protein [Vibrio cholerae]
MVNTIFNALGNIDFTFTCQKLNRTHFTHIHTYWIGGAANLTLYARKCRGGCFSSIFVSDGSIIAEGKIIGIRCGFHHLNAHVINHLNNIFHLL